MADLIAAVPGVPWLGDQLDGRQHGVLGDGIQEAGVLVVGAGDAGQGGGEVEAEAVDTHFLDPVAQAVHDHAQHIGVAQLERVAGACEVVVIALLTLHQVVVGAVVDAPEAQRRPQVVALGGMVVDDVQDDLDGGVVHLLDKHLEGADPLGPQVFGVRREEAYGVVAPVVAKPRLDQVAVLHEGVDRQQLDRGHAQRAQIVDDGRRRKAGEGAAHRLRHLGMAHGKAAHVHLVDHRLVPGALFRPAPPGEGGVDHPALRHVGGAVALVEGKIPRLVADLVAEHGVVPSQLADQGLGVRVDQQLVGIEAMPGRRIVGPVHPIAVKLVRPHIGKVAVPDFLRVLGQRDARGLGLAFVVEQAKLDLFGVGGKQREVGSRAVPGSAQRKGPAGPDAIVGRVHLGSPRI